MAAILNFENQQQELSYLNAYHCIGRSNTNVDMVINSPEISRTHAIIEWKDKQWFIRDLSTNGTWVNSYKLLKDQPHKLQVDDNVFFGQANAHGLLVKDLTRPENMLLAVESSGDTLADSPIILSDFNILPSEEQAEIALFYVHSKGQWYKEHLIDSDGGAYPIANSDKLFFDNKSWQLKLNNESENTLPLATPKLLASQIKYRFNLSRDEETTELNLITDEEKLPLSDKAHHYLTLSLARHKDSDARKGVEAESQGWILPEIIAKELGYDITLFNTQVCRAKKQFREVFKGACDGDELIERKGKKIRFAGSYYRIYKGNELIVNQGQDKVSLTVMHG
jgi:pSer/pThr/pTyr-binding forkhead associated (FHA) protein